MTDDQKRVILDALDVLEDKHKRTMDFHSTEDWRKVVQSRIDDVKNARNAFIAMVEYN